MGQKFYRYFLPLLYCLVFAGYPLAVLISELSPLPSTVVSIVVRAILVLIAVYIIARGLIGRGRLLPLSSFWFCSAILFSLYLPRFVSDLWITEVSFIEPFSTTLFLFGGVVLPFLAFSAIWVMPRGLRCLKFTFYFLLVICTIHFMFGYQAIGTETIYQGRLRLENFNAISLSVLGVQLTICLLYTSDAADE